MSLEDSVQIASEPKSSVEIEDLAGSVVKGAPKVSVKRYFNEADPGAADEAVADAKRIYSDLRDWSAPKLTMEPPT